MNTVDGERCRDDQKENPWSVYRNVFMHIERKLQNSEGTLTDKNQEQDANLELHEACGFAPVIVADQ